MITHVIVTVYDKIQSIKLCELCQPVAYPGFFFSGGVQQIQLRTEDRENGDLGVVAP